MMSISQFFILSPRGDTIISKAYRGDFNPGAAESFFRKVKFWDGEEGGGGGGGGGGDAPPVFQLDGLTYLWLRQGGLLFAATTPRNVPPALVLELLQRLVRIFKDYCGVLSEESIRKNFVLVYELLDEVLDYGFPQGTSTELLKNFIHNEPVLVEPRSAAERISASVRLPQAKTHTSAADKPVTAAGGSAVGVAGKGRNEIFVDIVERLNVLFSPNGYVLNSSIDGSIQMKSYLAGHPELRLALNEDLVVGRPPGGGGGGAPGGGYDAGRVVLDDCNFHERVRLDDFEQHRTLAFVPPDGEFAVLNYRVAGEFRAPFRLFPTVEEPAPHKLDLVLMIRSDIPETNHGSNVTIRVPVPRNTASASGELAPGAVGQTCEYDQAERRLVWTIKKFPGATEQTLRAKITLASAVTAGTRRELGPISMNFDIPMYNVSNLQVRYLRIAEQHKSYNPYRWVRYVTKSSSYVCRV